ncbi:T9SS type A sorting domain-containing protein [Aquimarina sp. D1M17]|uniref:PA domain-containing protein n=1 Tax=Aquimarina acroporae TaxID=2937283 RepID=UPI0020BD807C|nr:PA domain-containing protein [Aquimarina acroporae]MCK8523704.1 T9SS type A sorting domain-containing protein [Aquimarina acroporae]
MNKQLRLKFLILGMCFLFNGVSLFAQEIIPLAERTKIDRVKGDLIMTGNSIVGLVNSDNDDITYDPNVAYNGNLNNGDSVTAYIDIDGDTGTFSSSSADIVTPNPGCTTIAYAGLYWSATYYLEREQIAAPALTINNTALAGDYVIADNNFDPGKVGIPASPGLNANLVVAIGESGFSDGCDATLQNAADIAGNIAVVKRGFCSFTQKVINVQNAGAIGVIIVNNNSGLFNMPGDDAGITIPAVMIGQTDGEAIISEIESGGGSVNATLISNFTEGDEQLINLPLIDARKVGDADFRNIKFKTPGGTYQDVTAQSIIYDGYRNTPTNPSDVAQDDVPYVCYADVTDLINQSNTNGTYTIANMNATVGRTSGVSGALGGWTLVVVYEDPQASQKFVSTNDGYVQIRNTDSDVDFSHTELPSLPVPVPINAKFGISAMEGDKAISGDRVSILSTSNVYVNLGGNTANPTNNFFNSSITNNDSPITSRNPASTNTLGFDIDLFDLDNAGNSLIGNDQNSANFRLSTDGDTFRVFLTAFATEIIEPELSVLKRAYDINQNEITNTTQELGEEVVYILEVKNTGNENFVDGSVVVEAEIPTNSDLVSIDDAMLPPGTTYSTATPGKITYSIPASVVEMSDDTVLLSYKTILVSGCEDLRDSCSNIVQSSAIYTYTGELSGITVTNANSSSGQDSCGIGNGLATSFSLNVPPCSSDVLACAGELQLLAGTGYDQYTWSGPGIASPIVQTGSNANIFTIANPVNGTYSVVKEDTNPADGSCTSLTEEFNVTDFRPIENPILSYVNGTNVITENCSGIDIPQVLLCADQDFLLETGFDQGSLSSISWQRLSPTGACVLDPDNPCSLLSGDCTDANWAEEINGNTQSFTVSEAGDYRILAEFEGGCLQTFYFSVFKNDFQPELSMEPIECGNDGSVTVTNAPNNFAFSLTSGGPYSNTTGVFAIPSGSAGDITVYAIDTTFPECEYTATINVPEIDPQVNITATNPTCINDTNGEGFGRITIAVTDAFPEYQYTISGGNLTAPIVISNSAANNGNYIQNGLAPGTYTVEVITNLPEPSCTFTEDVTIEAAPSFTAEAVLIAPETCNSGAIIQVNVTSGAGDYLYGDGSGVFQASNTFEIPGPVDPNATYTFFVTDNNVPVGTLACVIEANVDGLEPYREISIDDITVVHPTCPEDFGNISVQVSPEVAGRTYTYRLLSSNTGDEITTITSAESDITFSNITEGTFMVEVLHNNSAEPSGDSICAITSENVTIIAPTAISFDASVTRPLSCAPGFEEAIITIDAISGGSGSYEWSLDPTSGFSNITAGPFNIPVSNDGVYDIYVRNQNTSDCTTSFTVTVEPLETINDIEIISEVVDCTADTIEVTATASPDGIDYFYSVSPSPVSGDAISGVFVLNRGSNYTFTATRQDNQCEYSKSYSTPTPSGFIDTDIAQISPISCFSEEEVTVSLLGGVGPFNFEEINNAVTSQLNVVDPSANFLLPSVGSYSFRITDTATGCFVVTDSYIIDEFDTIEILATQSSEISCFGDSDGAISIEFSGYVGGYDYVVSGGVGADITGTGHTANGSIVVTNLASGTYTVRVTATEAPFCDASVNITVTEPSAVVASLTLFDPVSVNDGQIEVSSSGGTLPFQYAINNGEFQASNVFTGLPGGDYEVTIQDANGCQTLLNATLNTPVLEDIVVDLDITGAFVNCYADSNAVIDATVRGGSGNYIYTLSGTSFSGETVNKGPQSNSEFGDLAAGNYQYMVSSEGVDDVSVPFAISNPPQFEAFSSTTPIFCSGSNEGTITVEVNGGTPPYSFAISSNPGTFFSDASDGVSNQHTFQNLAAASYEVLAQDVNGCSRIITVQIVEPTPILASIVNITPETCAQDSDGAFTITITGGTPPYETNISNNDADFVVGKLSYENLPGGSTEVFIRDSNGCRISMTVEIGNGLDLGAGMSTSTDCDVIEGNPQPVYDISIVIDNDNEISNVVYTLTGINGTPDPSNATNTTGTFLVTPGEYEGVVLHSSGCEVSAGTIFVEEYEEVGIDVVGTNPTNPGENGEITVNIFQGNGPYSVILDSEPALTVDSTSFTFTEVAAGDHQVTVIDNGGCSEQIATVTIAEEDKSPIIEYADEILFCAITGQSYPVVTIQDRQGEVVDLSFQNVVSIVWQKLDEVTCDIELEDNCPTSASTCSSDWFDIGTGNSNTVTESGEYRVVVNFVNRSGNSTKIYYFRVESKVSESDKEIVAFPNPSKDRVRLNTEVNEIRIYDVMGKMVMQTTENSYSIAPLPNGVYFAKVRTRDNKNIILKLIKE